MNHSKIKKTQDCDVDESSNHRDSNDANDKDFHNDEVAENTNNVDKNTPTEESSMPLTIKQCFKLPAWEFKHIKPSMINATAE